MMLHHPKCEVTARIEPVCSLDRIQLPTGMPVHFPEYPDPNGMASLVCLTIHAAEAAQALALVGPPCCCHTRISGDLLLVVQFDLLTLVSLPEGRILQRCEMDCPGGCLGLHPLEDGWLIHGEGAILRLDRELQPLWEYCGADIFASVTGKEAFTLTNDRILLWDFNDNYYELDLTGKLIKFIEKASV